MLIKKKTLTPTIIIQVFELLAYVQWVFSKLYLLHNYKILKAELKTKCYEYALCKDSKLYMRNYLSRQTKPHIKRVIITISNAHRKRSKMRNDVSRMCFESY